MNRRLNAFLSVAVHPGDRNIIMFYKSTLICSLLHFPTGSRRVLRAFQKYFTVCQVAVPLCKGTIVSLKRSPLSISRMQKKHGVNNLYGSFNAPYTALTKCFIMETKWFSGFAAQLLGSNPK